MNLNCGLASIHRIRSTGCDLGQNSPKACPECRERDWSAMAARFGSPFSSPQARRRRRSVEIAEAGEPKLLSAIPESESIGTSIAARSKVELLKLDQSPSNYQIANLQRCNRPMQIRRLASTRRIHRPTQVRDGPKNCQGCTSFQWILVLRFQRRCEPPNSIRASEFIVYRLQHHRFAADGQ